MKIHHLNCGTMCPLGAKLLPGVFPKKIVSHCLLIEDNQHLILVDTGFGLKDVERSTRLGMTGWALSPVLNPAETAFNQIKALGFSPSDVTDIIPTHLDLDHAGGIQDFPAARVHVARSELSAAQKRSGFVARERYRPRQFSDATNWVEYELQSGEDWNGFKSVREFPGLPPELLLVDLPGHTAGHMGVAVKGEAQWLLHAGDAYYHHNELLLNAKAPLGLRLFQRMLHKDYHIAMSTQRQLAHLHQRSDIKIFCSHDPAELPAAT